MSHILFVTWDGGGNVPPAMGIASELRARGHDVRFLGHGPQRERFVAAGIPFAAFRQARPFDATASPSLGKFLATFSDQGMGKDVLAELEEKLTDLVVVDCFLFGAMRALHRQGRDYVAFEHSFDGHFRRTARGPLGWLLRLRGVRPLQLIDAGVATLVPTLQELDRGHGDVIHTGPVVRGVPASAKEPTVLLSLSTVAFAGLAATWQRVLDAVETLPARVIATTGPAIEVERLRVPANVELHRWLAHEEVMPGVSMVVGHGGHATTMVALAHDLPLLILPMDSKTDQSTIGQTIEDAGAGLTLSRRSSSQRIRAAIEQLLGDASYRVAAARLGARIREHDGRKAGADVLESLAIAAAQAS